MITAAVTTKLPSFEVAKAPGFMQNKSGPPPFEGGIGKPGPYNASSLLFESIIITTAALTIAFVIWKYRKQRKV